MQTAAWQRLLRCVGCAWVQAGGGLGRWKRVRLPGEAAALLLQALLQCSITLALLPPPSTLLPSRKLWSLKEAFVKATGEGLGFELGLIEFQLSGSTGESLFAFCWVLAAAVLQLGAG